MKRNTITLLLVLFSASLFAQDLEQTLNDISVITVVKNTHKRENARLEEIEENQVKILIPTTITSKKTVELSLRQERMYNSLYKVFDAVDNLQLFLKILNESDDIYKALEDLYDISKEHPKAATVAGFSEFFVLKQSVTILGDLFRATQQSKFNLMNNAQRIKLMGRCLDSLVALKTYVYYMKTLVQTEIRSSFIDEIIEDGGITKDVDFSSVLSTLQDDYLTIFPDSLKDE